MLAECDALPLALGLSVALLSSTSLLFWTDMLPLLPRARATAPCARSAVRRSLLSLFHAAYFAAAVARHDGRIAGEAEGAAEGAAEDPVAAEPAVASCTAE